jgi:hypothetical protein
MQSSQIVVSFCANIFQTSPSRREQKEQVGAACDGLTFFQVVTGFAPMAALMREVHASQMQRVGPGPAISLSTSVCFFVQKEHESSPK